MRFEVYCDESRPDLLSSLHPHAQFMVIGSLWFKAEDREAFKCELHAMRDRHKVGGEFKWQKVSPSRRAFYEELVGWFHERGDRLRFRCIAVDQQQVDLKLYHEDDQELGFYKFYYQLLHHWVLDFNEYDFFVDFKSNRRRDRLEVLRQCLDCSNLSSRVRKVQAVRSEESVLIQLVDVLTGMAAYRLNGRVNESSAKFAVRFRKNQFNHCFYESSRRNGVKDVFSVRRAERIDWIKGALEDPRSERYQGWDKRRKRYDATRRVTLVMGNYVVVIALTGRQRADFVTAYVADTPATPGRPSTVDKIRRSPAWT